MDLSGLPECPADGCLFPVRGSLLLTACLYRLLADRSQQDSSPMTVSFRMCPTILREVARAHHVWEFKHRPHKDEMIWERDFAIYL